MSGLYIKRRRRPEINLVPLIDVLVMLIFFAFVTMQFKSVTTMNLTLPRVETAGKNEVKDQITIRIPKEINKGGSYEVQIGPRGIPVKEAELEKFVAGLPVPDKNITVVIASDENTELKYITAAMDACRKVGLNKIRLQSR